MRSQFEGSRYELMAGHARSIRRAPAAAASNTRPKLHRFDLIAAAFFLWTAVGEVLTAVQRTRAGDVKVMGPQCRSMKGISRTFAFNLYCFSRFLASVNFLCMIKLDYLKLASCLVELA